MIETAEVHTTEPDVVVPKEEKVPEEEKWDRKRVAQSIVNRHSAVAAGVGLIPVVGVDVVALTGVALNMINRLCDLYGVNFTRQAGLNFIMSLLAGTLPTVLLTTTTSMLKSVPFLGQLAGSAAMAVNGGAIVYALGRVMINHFETGGDLLNLDAKKAKAYFKEQMEAARKHPNPEWTKKETEPTNAPSSHIHGV